MLICKTLRSIQVLGTLGLTGLGLIGLSSCALGNFEDLEADTWVVSVKETGVAGLGKGLVSAGDSSTLSYVALGDLPATAVTVSFDAQGKRGDSPEPTVAEEIIPGVQALEEMTIAVNKQGFGEAKGNLALGLVAADQAYLLLLGSVPIKIAGGNEPTGIAFGLSDADAKVQAVDLFAISGASLSIIPDYIDAAIDGSMNAKSCALGTGNGEVMVAEVDASQGGAELVLSDGPQLLVATGNSILAAATAEVTCFASTPALNTIPAPAGEASFGSVLEQGDFDGNGDIDLVVAAPEQNAVYVFMNWKADAVMNAAGIKVSTPGASVAFGTSLAVGDFDGDGRDELVVGDPLHQIAAHKSAGSAYVFPTDSSGSFLAPHKLHDARAEDDQVFGQSLAVVTVGTADHLVVGAHNEVFTYFRTPVEGDDDFRQ